MEKFRQATVDTTLNLCYQSWKCRCAVPFLEKIVNAGAVSEEEEEGAEKQTREVA